VKKNDTTIGDALGNVMKQLKLENEVTNYNIRDVWQNMMSPAIHSRTEKILLRKDVLFIWINSAALKHELFLSREKLRQNLNEELDEEAIRVIIFK